MMTELPDDFLEFQRRLPSGIEIVEEVTSRGSKLGRVFRVVDRRLQSTELLPRTVRFLLLSGACRKSLLDRAAALMRAAPLPYVAVPREIFECPDSFLAILEDVPGKCLTIAP